MLFPPFLLIWKKNVKDWNKKSSWLKYLRGALSFTLNILEIRSSFSCLAVHSNGGTPTLVCCVQSTVPGSKNAFCCLSDSLMFNEVQMKLSKTSQKCVSNRHFIHSCLQIHSWRTTNMSETVNEYLILYPDMLQKAFFLLKWQRKGGQHIK